MPPHNNFCSSESVEQPSVQLPSIEQPRAGAFAWAWGTMLVLLGATAGLTLLVERAVHSAAAARFDSIEESTAGKIQQRMQAYQQILRGGVGLMASQREVTRTEWRQYVAALDIDANFPGIQGIGFAQHVAAADLGAYEKSVQAEGFPDFHVRPGGTRSEYTSITYLEPFDARNRRAFGFDMFAESVRRAAMSAARDTGKPALSGRVTLVQETDKDVQPGVLLYIPLYWGGGDPGTVAARRAALRGYVYAPFRLHNLMHGVLGGFDDSLDLVIYDGTRNDPAHVLFRHEVSPRPAVGPTHDAHFARRRILTLYGRQWLVEFRSTPQFEARTLVYAPHFVVLAGLLISILFSSLVWSLATRRQKAVAMAHEMTGVLGEREAFISAVVDHAADGIITLGGDGRVIALNRAAERIFGCTSGEVSGKPLANLLPDWAVGAGAAPIPFAQLGKTSVEEGQRRNGERFAAELAVSQIQVGEHQAYAAIVRDISQRLQAEEALRRSEERFDLAFQASNDGLWDWSMEDNRIYYSPSWCSMLGYAPDEVPQSIEFWRDIVHPDDYPVITAIVEQYTRGELPAFRHEHRLRRKDGTYMWILARAFAQRDATGRAFRLVGINTDIDQPKQVEQMKNQFVSVVSHELRTPVTSIYGSIMLLKQKLNPQSDVERTLVDMALRNSESLITLINDLLDMDKIQSGKLDIRMQPLALRPLLEEACERNRSYADQFGVTFELQEGGDELQVNGDATRLLQVMGNLLSNAAKFSHGGSSVQIALRRQGNEACITVADHGEGIPEAFRDRIFSKFSQADSSSTRPRNGSGLGLNISRSIVESLGGSIRFDSSEGQGTTFYVCLPLLPAAAD